jgi:hypothetical protein
MRPTVRAGLQQSHGDIKPARSFLLLPFSNSFFPFTFLNLEVLQKNPVG